MVALSFGQIFDIPMQIAKTIAIGAVGEVASVAGAAANEATDNFNAAAHSTTASAEITADEATATTVASSTTPSVVAPSQSASVVTVVQTSVQQTAPPTVTVIASEKSSTAPVTITVLPSSETKPSVVYVTQSSAEESTRKTELTSKHASSILSSEVDKHHALLYQNTTATVDENDKRALLKPRLAISTLMALSATTNPMVPQSHTPSIDVYSAVSTSTETYSLINDLGKRWLDSITLGQTAVPSSTFNAIDALAAPVTYSTCGPGQACYGTDGTLTTSVSIAATPTPDLKPSDDPITTTNPSASGSERLALYASPLVPARYRGDTLVREQVDGVSPYPIAGFASGWRPTAVTGMGSDGYRVLPPTGTAVAYGWNPTAVAGMGSAGYNAIPPTGTAAASRSPIWFGDFVPNPNDFIRTQWQESQKTWRRRPDLHERKATSTTDVTSVIGNPTSLATLAASPGFGWQDSHAISNPATAGATTMLDPNATSPIPFSTSAASIARLSDVKRAVEPKITSRSSVNEFPQPTTMATSYKPKTGGLSMYKSIATTNVAAPSKSSQKDDAEIKGSQIGSSQPKAGLEFPGVILDPNDEDMWAECTVGGPRGRSSRPRPNDVNKSDLPPRADIAGTGDKSDRSGLPNGASTPRAFPTKLSVGKRTLAQSRNDELQATYATVLPTGIAIQSPNSQPTVSSYPTRAGSSEPVPSGNSAAPPRRTRSQRIADRLRALRQRRRGSTTEPVIEAALHEEEPPHYQNVHGDQAPGYSHPPSYHSQEQQDSSGSASLNTMLQNPQRSAGDRQENSRAVDTLGGLHSVQDEDAVSTMEAFGDIESQSNISPPGSGARPPVSGSAGANQPDAGQYTSANPSGQSGGGNSATGGQGSSPGGQPWSSSWQGASDKSGRRTRKRGLTARSNSSKHRRTGEAGMSSLGIVDRETITADSLIELHSHARRSPGGSQSKHDKGERHPRRCRKKKDKKRPKNQLAHDEFECEPEPQIETQGAQPDANTPYGAQSSQPFSPPGTVQKQANTGAAPQQPGYDRTGEAVENPPFVYQKRPPTPPYPPQDGQPSDHGLDKWEDLPPADRRKLMYNKQLKEMYPDDSSEDFYPPLRPASLAPTEPDTNRWTGGRLSQDGRNMYTPPGDMSSSISSGVSESRYNPYKQEKNRGQSSSKPPRRNRLRRRFNQPLRDPPSYADANAGRPEPVPSQSGDDDAEASDDEPPGYTGKYHLNQRKRTDVADQRTGVPQGPDEAPNRQNAGLGVSR